MSLPISGSFGSDEAAITRRILDELNAFYKATYGHSFIELLLKYCGKKEGIGRRETPIEKKQKRREMLRNVSAFIENVFNENIAINFLCEYDSLEAFNERRLSLSFEKKNKPSKGKTP